jgi:pimeloyl-ACP methyl ester carboxylesterase
LVLRGADSDILLADTATEMTQRGPAAKLIEFAGIGHAPTLQASEQIAAIEDFLNA